MHQISATRPYPLGKTVTPYKSFLKLAEEPAEVNWLYGQTVQLEPIAMSLPTGAQNAFIAMSPQVTQPLIPASNCEVTVVLPTTACRTDPLYFHLPPRMVDRIVDTQDLLPNEPDTPDHLADSPWA